MTRHKKLLHHFVRRVRDKSYGELFLIGKFGLIAIVTGVPAILAGIVITKAIVETNVIMTALRVPHSLEQVGFTSETVTQRLLDEIAVLNRKSIAAKPRRGISDREILDSLASVETLSGSLDLKSFQSLVQRAIGKTLVQISGEITSRKEEHTEIYRLRLRQTPGRGVLIDVETGDGPDDLFKKAALNLMERVDPEIAAGIYYRNLRDASTALRLIEISLIKFPTERKYALNLKSYISSGQGRLSEAMQLSEEVRRIDPKFAGGYYSQAAVLRRQGKYAQALEVADHAVSLDRLAPQGHYVRGLALQSMEDVNGAAAEFRQAIGLDSQFVAAHLGLGALFRDTGRTEQAAQELFTASVLIADNAEIRMMYAQVLVKQNKRLEAEAELSKSIELDPKNLRYKTEYAQLLLTSERSLELAAVVSQIRSRINAGEKIPADIRANIDRLLTSDRSDRRAEPLNQ
jgi:tetratricopeptide (TPR) repeat protein